MSWNYRVFREQSKSKGQFIENYYTIRHAYYNDDDKTNIPHSCSEPFSHPTGLDLDELRIDLCRMIEACGKPVLILRDNKIYLDPAGS